MAQQSTKLHLMSMLLQHKLLCRKLIRSLVHQKLDMAHAFQKTYYDKRVHGDPSDFVWLFSPAVPQDIPRNFIIPCLALTLLASFLTVTIASKKLTGRKTICVVHFDQLKPCHPATRMDDSLHVHPPITPTTHNPTLMLLTRKF